MSIDDSTVWLRREGGADVDGGGGLVLAWPGLAYLDGLIRVM